jgi:membrane protease YdiL (CAAX protease family)
MDAPEKPGRMLREGVLVVLAYVAVRAVVYHHFPIHTSEDWSRRDGWMTVPRTLGFLALLLLNRFRWRGIVRPEWSLRPVDGVAALLAAGVYWFSAAHCRGPAYVPEWMAVGIAATVAVALFEEAAFRGAILSGLREVTTEGRAIIFSAFLFAVFHFQAQPLYVWPLIAATGVVLANLRTRGLGLGWLAALHGFFDIAFFFFGTEGPLESAGTCAGEFAAMVALAWATWPGKRRAA